MKKFGTLALATALTAALACTAFADDALLTKTGNTSGAEKYEVDLSGLTEDQLESVVQAVADVTVDSGYCNGTIGANLGGDWSSMNPQGEVSGDGETSGQFVWDLDGSLVSYDDDGNLAPYMEVQLWWVNPFYDEDGAESGEGTATVTAVTLYDASGNVVLSTSTGAATDDTTDDASDGSTDSGDTAPVAYLAAVVALAGVALVASKKARA